MSYFPVDGNQLFYVANVVPYTKQGTSFIVGGGFTTTSGKPSQQLLASTNTTMGYYTGQMLAYANGDGSGMYAGLTAGAQVNWDPASSDTGQAVWNQFIINDAGLTQPLPLNVTYDGSLQCMTARQNWVVRQQFLYGPSTPAGDATIVQAAIAEAGIQSQSMTPADGTTSEVVFAY
jgi:hypothetical protein